MRSQFLDRETELKLIDEHIRRFGVIRGPTMYGWGCHARYLTEWLAFMGYSAGGKYSSNDRVSKFNALESQRRRDGPRLWSFDQEEKEVE